MVALGIAAYGLAFLLLRLPSKSLIVGFGIIAFITIGFAMITAFVMVWLLNLIQPITKDNSDLVAGLLPEISSAPLAALQWLFQH